MTNEHPALTGPRRPAAIPPRTDSTGHTTIHSSAGGTIEWTARNLDDSTLDSTSGPDATLTEIEHKFDDRSRADDPDRSDDSADTDSDQDPQNPRLTLLHGGVTRTLSVPAVGAPVSITSPSPALRDTTRRHAPLSRYKAPPAGPPVWSADAGWHDLTIRRDVPPPSPALAAALTPGWTHRWLVTYRHGKNDYTASAASVGEADLFAGDPIRVNSWHKNKTARAGLRFMEATGRLHAHESLFERKLLCALDFHGASNIYSQPFTLTWHDGVRERNHTPDFLVVTDGNIVIVNTRPAHLVRDPLLDDCTAVGELAMSRGWDHALVVGYPTPAFTIIDTISAHSDTPDHLGYTDDILDFLDRRGPTPFADVCAALSSPIMGRAVLQRLIWERQVSIDLAVPLEDHSLVALPGREVRS
ncbi:hypothetical protein QWJ41_07015 [Nocardioides sp. SOB44]|jgi:hypothetical protein|uniref:TnsA-like heteromeric transposase endonuclease subunit n=1 Tax=Nocardioides cremeus TaxID=3058044 RepID=A0ABT8TQG9_9ACTN|nr:hypothetical protein [Nocardioides cremeus]MDO3395458.1 hypothetical protein [Nocardioides cremeus]